MTIKTDTEFRNDVAAWLGDAAQEDASESSTLTGADPDAPFQFPDYIFGDFAKASEIEHIADALIHQHRTRFAYLSDAKVTYLWKAKGGTSAGKLRLGACQKPSGLLSFFSGTNFVIWIALDNCKTLRLTNRQMEALVYHELLHTDAEEDEDTGEEIYTLRPHDFEGFNDELKHYGAWSSDLKAVADMAEQLTLNLDGGQ